MGLLNTVTERETFEKGIKRYCVIPIQFLSMILVIVQVAYPPLSTPYSLKPYSASNTCSDR